MVEIGEVIKTARIRKGMSGPELAEAVGVDKSMISKWENGSIPKPKTRQKLENVLEIDLTSYEAQNQFKKSNVSFGKDSSNTMSLNEKSEMYSTVDKAIDIIKDQLNKKDNQIELLLIQNNQLINILSKQMPNQT